MFDEPMSEALEQVLHDQVIDEAEPGSVLRDFQVVLDFVGIEGVKSGGKYNVLPLDSLAELNQRLSRPVLLELKRPRLQSNPYLTGLNLLLRASGIGHVNRTGANTRLAVDREMLEQWRHLNRTEQYFSLLESWFFHARPEMVGERSDILFYGFLARCLMAWRALRAGPRDSAASREEPVYLPGIGREMFNLALMDMFGLVRVEQPSRAVASWFPTAVHRTPFGDALFTLVGSRFQSLFHRALDDDEATEAGPLGPLRSLLQPYFPEWEESLALPDAERRDGVFIFRASLGKLWRRLAVPSDAALDDLVAVILKAMKFDNSHLYKFVYRDRFGAELRVAHPACEEGPFTSEVLIGELPLALGQSMELTYDFGDNWRFDVKLERIDPPSPKIKSPRILERHGEAPKQYGSFS